MVPSPQVVNKISFPASILAGINGHIHAAISLYIQSFIPKLGVIYISAENTNVELRLESDYTV